MLTFLVLCALALGYFIGILQNGINIKITKPEYEPETDKEGKPVYNEGIPSNEEITRYVEKNNGVKNW